MSDLLLPARYYSGNVHLDQMESDGTLSFSNEIASMRSLTRIAYQIYDPTKGETAELLTRLLNACAQTFTDYNLLRMELEGRKLFEHACATIERSFPRDIAAQFIQQATYLIESTIFQTEDAILAMDASVPASADEVDNTIRLRLALDEADAEKAELLLAPAIPPPIPTKLQNNAALRFLENYRLATEYFSAEEELIIARKLSQRALTLVLCTLEHTGKINLELISAYLNTVKTTFTFLRNCINWQSGGSRRGAGIAFRRRLPANVKDTAILNALEQSAHQLGIDIRDLEFNAKESSRPQATIILPSGELSI